MTKRLNGINPLSYRGVNAVSPPNATRHKRPPTPKDSKGFNLGDIWIEDTKSSSNAYILIRNAQGIADWGIVRVNEEVITTNSTPTTIFSLLINELEGVSINAQILGVNSLYTAGVVGTIDGGARRQAGGTTTIIGAPVIDISEDSAGSPTFDLAVIGNNLIIEVTGEAGVTYTWKADIQLVRL